MARARIERNGNMFLLSKRRVHIRVRYLCVEEQLEELVTIGAQLRKRLMQQQHRTTRGKVFFSFSFVS